jgi:hypothetical protein
MVMYALRLSFAPALVALVLPMGCATDDIDSTAPIAAIALTNGNQLEFYEPSPGWLFVSEAGTAGAAPTVHNGRTPVELYRDLAPNGEVPEVLVAAEARLQARRADPTPAPFVAQGTITPKTADVAPGANFIDNQSCDDQWFSNNFCGGSPDWQMCLLNHWNGAWAQLSSVDHVDHAVCADIGAITLKVQMGDGTGGIWDVPEGHWRSFSWQDGCLFGCNTSTRGDVLNATNNRFHYAVNAWF